MKGVMMLINLFPPYGGGTERQAERLAAYLAQQNVFAGVITRKLDDSNSVEVKDGFMVFRIPEVGPWRIKSVSFVAGAFLTLIRYSKSFDILHAHLAFAPAVAACVAGKILGKRVIVKFGNSGRFGDMYELKRTWRGRLSLAIIRQWADLYIALTDDIEKELLDAGFAPARIARVVNGVNTVVFCPSIDKQAAKTRLGLSGQTVLLYTGRLTAQKALPNLFMALKQVVGRFENVHLLLVGDGEEQSALEKLAEEQNIKRHVTFTGRQDSVKIYLDAADIFVLPSIGEGISNSLLEAMSAGLACVATRVGGSVDVLGEGAGILVSPNNIEELSGAILQLVSDPVKTKAMGARARQRAVDCYDLDAIGARYFDLYRKLSGEFV
jgi:glycosyltransferase involved in cell wall biosynthesis